MEQIPWAGGLDSLQLVSKLILVETKKLVVKEVMGMKRYVKMKFNPVEIQSGNRLTHF
jgi:hypothetical protein